MAASGVLRNSYIPRKTSVAEARDTDEQPKSDIPLLIRCGAIYSAWHSTKFCVKDMKDKSV